MEKAPLHHNISTAPDTGAAYWITAKDGLQLRIGVWQSSNRSRGTVLFFPGRGDYIELFGHPIAALVDNGYAVLVIDWRGHGLSGRVSKNPKTGHVEHFSDYQMDVDAMVAAAKELDLPEPRCRVAHNCEMRNPTKSTAVLCP